jgi:hypothetical protein
MPASGREQARMQILRAGVLYFVVVFGAGFVLGLIRILWVVTRVGMRTAELLEMPVMLLVMFVAARWIIRSLAIEPILSRRLGMGGIALCMLVLAEFALVPWLRGISIRQYFTGRDLVAGTVYYMMLGLFSVMPYLVARRYGRPGEAATR